MLSLCGHVHTSLILKRASLDPRVGQIDSSWISQNFEATSVTASTLALHGVAARLGQKASGPEAPALARFLGWHFGRLSSNQLQSPGHRAMGVKPTMATSVSESDLERRPQQVISDLCWRCCARGVRRFITSVFVASDRGHVDSMQAIIRAINGV